jgi:Protein of unknown function (DUF1084)
MSTTSDYAFDCILWSLSSLYVLLGTVSLVQFIRLHVRDDESTLRCDRPFCTVLYDTVLYALNTMSLMNNSSCSYSISTKYSLFWPATVQQQVHMIIVLLCAVRTAFFFVAVAAWDPYTGEVDADKVAFYSLDEFATVFFFNLTSALALFWAELYYISTEDQATFTTYVRPVTYFINIAALVGAALCSYYVSTTYSDDINYIFYQYTILVATVYFLSAIMFGYYAYVAAAEIKQVPVQLSARRSRLSLLRWLGTICISALIIKASIVIYLTGQTIPTTSNAALACVFLYYFFLELFPLVTVLIFYRIETPEAEEAGDDDKAETTPLIDSKASRTVSPIRMLPKYSNNSAPTDVVEKIIARLSGASSARGAASDSNGLGIESHRGAAASAIEASGQPIQKENLTS